MLWFEFLSYWVFERVLNTTCRDLSCIEDQPFFTLNAPDLHFVFRKKKVTNAVYATICCGYDHIVFKHLKWFLPSSRHLNSVLMLCSLWSYWVCSFFFCFVLCRSCLKTACNFRSAWVCSRWRVICLALFLAKRRLLICWKSSAGIWGRESYSTASSNSARTACRYTNSQSSLLLYTDCKPPAISHNMHSLT